MMRSGVERVLVIHAGDERATPMFGALEEAGYALSVVPGPAFALDLAAPAPDLAVLDVGTADAEVVRRLRAESRTASIPIVRLVTGRADDPEAFGAGCVDAMAKPVRLSELIARIERHLRAMRSLRCARSALDAFGQATLLVRQRDGRRLWQTALAREWLQQRFPDVPEPAIPAPVLAWIAREALRRRAGADPLGLTIGHGPGRLSFEMHALATAVSAAEEWLLVLRQDIEPPASG